jgi:site-specific recombinase XerD
MTQGYFPTGPFLSQLPDKGGFDILREDFLLGFKESTARAYKADLEDWWEWCEDERLDALRPGEEQLERYLRGVAALGYSLSTVRRRAAALRGLSHHRQLMGACGERPPTLAVLRVPNRKSRRIRSVLVRETAQLT